MDDLEYLDAFDEDGNPIPERHDNGNIGGVISAVMAWVVFLVLFVLVCDFIGGFL